MMDMCTTNAYNSYKLQTGKKLPLRQFSKKVVATICEIHYTVSHSTPRSIQEPVPERFIGASITSHHLAFISADENQGKKKQRRCHICYNTKAESKTVRCVTTYRVQHT